MSKSIKTEVKGSTVAVTCTKCGEPITKTGKYNCTHKESKEAYEKISQMFGGLLK